MREKGTHRPDPTKESLAFNVTITERDCWEWRGRRTHDDYGQVWISSEAKMLYAHRVSYELWVGPIPAGLTIDHLCRITRCINPWHLEPVTFDENQRRAALAIKHCKRGHEFTERNSYWRIPKGAIRPHRTCRQCNREAVEQYRARRRTAA